MDANQYIELLETAKGHGMTMEIETILQEDGYWKGSGSSVFSMTRDGENWGYVEIKANSLDSDYKSAIATVMLALTNAVNDIRFAEEMLNKVEESERHGYGTG
jgi:hypothetical protein